MKKRFAVITVIACLVTLSAISGIAAARSVSDNMDDMKQYVENAILCHGNGMAYLDKGKNTEGKAMFLKAGSFVSQARQALDDCFRQVSQSSNPDGYQILTEMKSVLDELSRNIGLSIQLAELL